jgi:D-alanyl-lipoteichoic acid acyltransferase DltB (MBOAT superfamily)
LLYNSFQFLFVFLPICLLVYFVTARASRGLANVTLCIASFYFYAWKKDWHVDVRLLTIIGISIAVNYSIGLLLREQRLAGRRAFAALTIGVVANLTALAYYKYANFALWNWAALTGRHFSPLAIALPLGISFFTFTQIAFLVDAYRGKARELGFARYCLFVAFFPHLIAGPIVHHSELMPQFAAAGAKRWLPVNVHIGIAFLTLGLFKKVIIADTCAPWADRVFDAAGSVGFLDAWRGAIAYTMQLYFDFSGYSDMAIGLAMMFNIRLPDNFNSPYKSLNIVDFWRRWHMTLSRFLRDYLYIPLGGNRKGEGRRQLNLMLTMLLGGIWHGAGWNFAAWGAYHGALLTINHAWEKRGTALPTWLARFATFIAVVVGWVMFRASSINVAADRLRSMAGFAPASAPPPRPWSVVSGQVVILAALLVFVAVAPNTKQWTETRELNPRRAIMLGLLFFLCVLWMHDALLSHAPQPFIYFQF